MSVRTSHYTSLLSQANLFTLFSKSIITFDNRDGKNTNKPYGDISDIKSGSTYSNQCVQCVCLTTVRDFMNNYQGAISSQIIKTKTSNTIIIQIKHNSKYHW